MQKTAQWLHAKGVQFPRANTKGRSDKNILAKADIVKNEPSHFSGARRRIPKFREFRRATPNPRPAKTPKPRHSGLDPESRSILSGAKRRKNYR
jgi:hypothetical protein